VKLHLITVEGITSNCSIFPAEDLGAIGAWSYYRSDKHEGVMASVVVAESR
jgi:hypothetical protein